MLSNLSLACEFIQLYVAIMMLKVRFQSFLLGKTYRKRYLNHFLEIGIIERNKVSGKKRVKKNANGKRLFSAQSFPFSAINTYVPKKTFFMITV